LKHATATATANEGLVRVIGAGALGLGVMNLVVGAGIFVLPGRIAAELGPAAILAYLICGLAVALVFLCFAEVGSRVTRSGGTYAYIEEAFGPYAGFVASVLFWFGFSALADAAITVAMVEVMATVFPILGSSIPRALFILGLFLFMALVNIRGARAGMRLVVINTLVKLIPLVLLLVVGLFAINGVNLSISEWPSVGELGAGVIILFFAFGGAEGALSVSGEIKRPSRTVPLGLLYGIGGLLVLYVGLQTVAQGVLGPQLAAETDAPLTAVAVAVFGDWGGRLLLAGLVFSIYGALSGDMLATPRVIYASARAGNLPPILARVHPTYKTPYVAVIFLAVVVCAFALTGTFRYLAVFATGSLLLIDLGVILAVPRLRARDGLPGPGQFRLPFGLLIPVLSGLLIGWMLLQVPAGEAMSVAGLIVVTTIYYVLRRRSHRPAAGGAPGI